MLNNLQPQINETPTSFADRLGVYYASRAKQSDKKEKGQFFTPKEIAYFMASFSSVNKKNNIKILDPGCGIGILSTAVIEKLVLSKNKINTIELVVFENDVDIIQFAEICFDYLRQWLKDRNIDFKIFLCKNDFILHNSQVLNDHKNSVEEYDMVISNPPYFKINSNDERAITARSVIYGQTNIYTIFLLIAAKLLKAEGELIFLTPRSFCSGNYYKLFREIFFSIINLKEIHLFNSRTAAFKKDKVLQENIILKAKKRKKNDLNTININGEIVISSSTGIVDINERRIRKYNLSNLLNWGSNQKILHLPTSDTDEEIIKIFKTWTGSLKLYNLEISTGPVVDFRSKDMIKFKKYRNTVPLIWLHNVESMKFNWPISSINRGKGKGQYIVNHEISFSRLLKNKNYIFVRRFSAKGDKRRLIAAPYFKSFAPKFPLIGLENHLNYIYQRKGELNTQLIFGISALLNSKLFDLYFRTFNGNINVSATELRDFPLPNYELILSLGLKIRKIIESNYEYDIDTLVSETFNLSIDLSKEYGQ